jgi:hypothetical protein
MKRETVGRILLICGGLLLALVVAETVRIGIDPPKPSKVNIAVLVVAMEAIGAGLLVLPVAANLILAGKNLAGISKFRRTILGIAICIALIQILLLVAGAWSAWNAFLNGVLQYQLKFLGVYLFSVLVAVILTRQISSGLKAGRRDLAS